MAGLSLKTALRAGATLPLLLLVLALVPGCDVLQEKNYPEDLNYPTRTDPIVIKPPDTPITQLDQPGHLQQWTDGLPGKGGKLLDPTAGLEKYQLAKINEYLGKSHFDLSE